jgi:Flp pilus assembly protein TadG
VNPVGRIGPSFLSRHSAALLEEFTMLLRSVCRAQQGRRAVAAVELAVLAPFLALLFLIAVDFCRVFYFSVTLDNCARNGAEYGSHVLNSQDWQNSGSLIDSIQDATVAEGSTLNPPLPRTNVAATWANDSDGNPMVRVTVNYQFQTLTGFSGGPMNLVRTAQMRVAPQAPNN